MEPRSSDPTSSQQHVLLQPLLPGGERFKKIKIEIIKCTMCVWTN